MNQPAIPARSLLPQLVALALLLLTAAALFWPQQPGRRGDGALLVLMPEPDPLRRDALGELAAYLEVQARIDLRVVLADDRAALIARLPEALVILCPDAVALTLPASSWQPLVAGRRRVPWNLRPTSVLVSRRGVASQERPWLTVPERTVFGDSLSLVCLAPLCLDDDPDLGGLPAGVAWGTDPFDHRGVLAAAQFGAFDHVVVRQWDADLALATGRLDPRQWLVRQIGDPVPDMVALASRKMPRGLRLELQEALSILGRRAAGETDAAGRLEARLGALGFEGFNLLLGPDFERLRRRYGSCWPHSGP